MKYVNIMQINYLLSVYSCYARLFIAQFNLWVRSMTSPTVYFAVLFCFDLVVLNKNKTEMD